MDGIGYIQLPMEKFDELIVNKFNFNCSVPYRYRMYYGLNNNLHLEECSNVLSDFFT